MVKRVAGRDRLPDSMVERNKILVRLQTPHCPQKKEMRDEICN